MPVHQQDIDSHWIWPLVEQGLTVFPLGAVNEEPPAWAIERSGGDREKAKAAWPKMPRGKWAQYQKAKPSDTQVAQWIVQHPGCNFAIATGKEIDVVDADDAEAVQWVRDNLTRTPWTVKTTKGVHFYYQTNEKLTLKNSADEHAKVDTRGYGGYVVAPGSVHNSGQQYVLEVDKNWPIDSIKDLPSLTAEDLEKINAYKRSSLGGAKGNLVGFDASRYAPALATGVQEGGRNQNMTRLVGSWIQQGYSVDQVLARAMQTNAGNQPPLPEQEVITIVQSVTATHARNNAEKVVDLVVPEAPAQIPITRVTDKDLFKPIEYLIDDFLVERTTSLIWGPPGCGKSFVAIDMGLCVATGTAWHGHEVSQGDVVYVCGEGFNGIPLRVAAWQKHHEIRGSINFFMTEVAVPIAAPGATDQLLNAIQQITDLPKLIIIDTLNRNFGAGSENEQKDMDLYIGASQRISERLNCNTLTVHHAGKNSDNGPRGSTTLIGAVYTNLEMTEPQKDQFSLITHKQKDGPEAPPVRLEMPVVDLGTAKDSRGRVRPIGSRVVVVTDDVTIGANAAANIIGSKDKKKAGKNQALLINACRAQVKNIPAEAKKLVDRPQLADALASVGVPKNRRSELIKWAIDQSILVPVSAKNGLVLEFFEPG
ncbi:MAG: AAA family ATPase [Pseudomonadota bacterium]